MGDGVACSVLVPVLNEERYVEQAVDAMRRQRFDGGLEFIFADGGSSDRTREILQRLAEQDPRIRVFDNPSRSVSSGLNVCLSHARGRWVVRMDAHTVYPDDYIARGVARLREGGTRWVSGPQIPTGRGPVSRAVALALGRSLGRGGSRKWGVDGGSEGAEYELDTGVFTGVWERSTLLQYGGWDERWPRNSDSEMAARFLANGDRLICLPAMGGRYVPRDSFGGLWRQYVDYGEFRARTYRRHPHSMRLSHLLAPAIVLTGATAAAGPRPLRRLARFGEVIYLASLAAAGVRSLSAAEVPTDAALVPVALLVMHHGHGTGQIKGWRRYGVPVVALARLARLSSDGAAGGDSEPVYAPSLSRPAEDAGGKRACGTGTRGR
jgi:glycosyltransferase involved in cell wall biosynthesis